MAVAVIAIVVAPFILVRTTFAPPPSPGEAGYTCDSVWRVMTETPKPPLEGYSDEWAQAVHACHAAASPQWYTALTLLALGVIAFAAGIILIRQGLGRREAAYTASSFDK